MAEGVARTAGIGGLITLGGRQWTVRGRTVGYYALLEAEILRLRGNPYEMICSAAIDAVREAGVDQRINAAVVVDLVSQSIAERFRNWKFASYVDYGEFYNTPYGEAFQIWASIKHEDGSLTVEQVRFWLMEEMARNMKVGREHRDEIISTINRANEDPTGNSTGLPVSPETTGQPTGG